MRRVLSRRLAATATGLMVAALATGCGSSGAIADPTDGGAIVAQTDVVTDSAGLDRVTMPLPTGQLDLSIAPPQQQIAATDAGDGETHQAPAGGSFVGVDWQLAPGAGVPAWLGPLLMNDQVEPQVSIQAGGQSYPVSEGNVFVPVAGTQGATSVTVTFDGVQERMALPDGRTVGAVQQLREVPSALSSQPCTDHQWVAPGSVSLTCSYASARVPYLTGLGWRQEGWTVVELSMHATSYTRGSTSFSLGSMTEATRLDGHRPRRVMKLVDTDGYLTTYLVFEGGQGHRLDVDRSAVATQLGGGGARRLHVRFRARLPLG